MPISVCAGARCGSVEDSTLMIIIEQSLIFIYLSVLMIKSCNVSEDLCTLFGFGESSSGESTCASWFCS